MSKPNNKKIISKKLSDVPYVGDPKKSITQNLTAEEIKDLLDGYKITEFQNLKLLHHIRYFSKNETTGEVSFRTGGTIVGIDYEKEYLALSSGTLSWSVQKKNNVFHQAMPLSMVREEIEKKCEDHYRNIINKQDGAIKELYSQIKKLDNLLIEKNNEIVSLNKTIKKLSKK